MGQIFTQQRLLSREEGGGRPVARGPLRLHPIPHKRLLRENEPHSSPAQKAQLYPFMHTYRGVTSTHPQPQPGNRPEGPTGGISFLGCQAFPPFQDSSGDSNLTKCPLPNLLFSGGWKGGGSKESGYSEERDAEGWRQDVQGMETGRENKDTDKRERSNSTRGCERAGGGLLMGPEKRNPQGHSQL